MHSPFCLLFTWHLKNQHLHHQQKRPQQQYHHQLAKRVADKVIFYTPNNPVIDQMAWYRLHSTHSPLLSLSISDFSWKWELNVDNYRVNVPLFIEIINQLSVFEKYFNCFANDDELFILSIANRRRQMVIAYSGLRWCRITCNRSQIVSCFVSFSFPLAHCWYCFSFACLFSPFYLFFVFFFIVDANCVTLTSSTGCASFSQFVVALCVCVCA